MKINLLSIDREQFMVHDHIVYDEPMVLVQPMHIGATWTQTNKIFRSSLWDIQGNLISAGFPKFTNWGESPETFPVPTELKNCVTVEKLDGSLLIVSKYKGQFILRTRGTVDAYRMENAFELEIFKKAYPKVFELQTDIPTWDYSLLFEWTSPKNRIVIWYGNEPTFKLVGKVNHEDYSLSTQPELNILAKKLDCGRPDTFTFKNISDMMLDVADWQQKEGLVVSSNNGQTLHKIKGVWYLALHRLKSSLSSFDNIVDLWFVYNEPTYSEFKAIIEKLFDFEMWQQIERDVARISYADEKAYHVITEITEFIPVIKTLPTRKQQAKDIISFYGSQNMTWLAFKLLDNKPITQQDNKKLLYQLLED